MTNLNEFRPAIPLDATITKDIIRQGEDILNRLKTIIDNPTKSHKLFIGLKEKEGTSNPFYKLPMEITLVPGLKISIYVCLFTSKNGTNALGGYGAKKNLFKKSLGPRIKLALKSDPQSQTIYWDEVYRSVMIHELTHASQALTTVIRYLKIHNQPINAKSIERLMIELGSKSGSRSKLVDYDKANEVEKLSKDIAYQSIPSELGANANVIIEFLSRNYGTDAIFDIIDCVEKGHPTFKDIDNAMRDADRRGSTIWGTYDKLIDREMTILGTSREEWTKGYELKKNLLKVISKFYRSNYNK